MMGQNMERAAEVLQVPTAAPAVTTAPGTVMVELASPMLAVTAARVVVIVVVVVELLVVVAVNTGTAERARRRRMLREGENGRNVESRAASSGVVL